MSLDLEKKKILLIAPVFYQYHIIIIDELKKFGADVLFFPERKDNYLFTFYNNFNKSELRRYQNKHYNSILKDIEGEEIDILFVIRGFMLPEFFVQKLKQRNIKLKTVMSQWDANKENPYFHLVGTFDRVLSFDYEDCLLNKQLLYRPLFYTQEVIDHKENNNELIYDYFFMGAYISERYEAMLSLKKAVKGNKFRAKIFMYIPFKTYVKERIKGKVFDKEIISTKPLDRKSYLELLSRTKVVVDVSNKNQSGLAMRVIESIGAGKKILTNNKFIVRERAYNETRVSLFNIKEDFEINETFLNSEIKNEIDNEYYSLKSWLEAHFKDL